MNGPHDIDGVTVYRIPGPGNRTYSLLQRNGTDHFFMRHDELILGSALNMRKSEEDVWEQYLERGGESFRDGLFAKHGCEQVLFTDNRSYQWLRMEWAMDFCAHYNPALKETILTYYRHNKMGVRGPGVVTEAVGPAQVDTSFHTRLSELVNQSSALVNQSMVLMQEGFHQVNGRVDVVNGRVDAIEETSQRDRQVNHQYQVDSARHIAANDRQVEAIQREVRELKRTYTQYDRTVRGFCENVCGYQPSIEKAKDWGFELTRRYGSHMPGGKFPKTQCQYGGRAVNYYEPWMLVTFFTELGIYTPPDEDEDL